MNAPVLPIIPLFAELTRLQPRLSRSAVVVYGTIAAFQAAGHEPTVPQIADALYVTEHKQKSLRKMIAQLERANMLRREGERAKQRFVLLGPRWKR